MLFIAVVFSSIFTMLYTNTKFNEFLTDLKKIDIAISCDEWAVAENKVETLCSKFNMHENKMQMFLDRNNLKKAQQDLNKLKITAKFKEKSKSKTQILKIQNDFNNIMEDEKPLIKNIF